MEITRDIAKKCLEVVDAGLVSGLGKPIPGQMCVEAAICYALGLPHSDDPKCVEPILRRLKIRLNDSAWSSNEARTAGLRRLALIQLGSRDNLDDKEFARRLVDLAIGKQVPIALRAAASIHKDSNHKAALLAAADRCEKERNKEAALNAKGVALEAKKSDAAAYASDAAASAAAYAYASASDAYAYASDAYASAAAAYASAAAYAYASAAASDAAAYADKWSKAKDKVMAEFCEDVVQILVEMGVPGAQWLDLAPLKSGE